MKHLTIILAAAAIALASCSKSKSTTPAPAPVIDSGTIQLINTSTNPYYLYINGAAIGTLNGQFSYTYKRPYGTYALEVKQASGYVFTPTDETFNVVVSASNNPVITFP